MSNSPYKNRSNLLKGIGTLCVFIIFGYYAYQDSINRKMLERSLNENASPTATRLQLRIFSITTSVWRTWKCGL